MAAKKKGIAVKGKGSSGKGSANLKSAGYKKGRIPKSGRGRKALGD